MRNAANPKGSEILILYFSVSVHLVSYFIRLHSGFHASRTNAELTLSLPRIFEALNMKIPYLILPTQM